MSRFTCKECGKPVYESTIFGWRHHNIADAFFHGIRHAVDPVDNEAPPTTEET